jgi:NAD-dependent deacetylase
VNAVPNIGHQILAKWEQLGFLRGVITQNIDGLHQLASSQRVLELHGNARQVACLACDYRASASRYVEQFLATKIVPNCPLCRGFLKHATVSFGQILPRAVVETATQWCMGADLLFALGSSLMVTPAAELPRLAKRAGARLVIINHEPTPLDAFAEVVINDSIGRVLEEIDAQLADFRGADWNGRTHED